MDWWRPRSKLTRGGQKKVGGGKVFQIERIWRIFNTFSKYRNTLPLIIGDIHSNHITKCQKGVFGIQKSTMEAKAHEIRKCGVDDGLRTQKAKEMGNHAAKHQMLKKSHENHKFFRCKVSNTAQMGQYGKHHSTLKHQ